MIERFQCVERREFRGQIRHGQLIEVLRAHDVLQEALTHIHELRLGRQFIFGEIVGSLRQQYLAAVPRRHDALSQG